VHDELRLTHIHQADDLALSSPDGEQPAADHGPRHPGWTVGTGYTAPPRPEDLVQFTSKWPARPWWVAQHEAGEVEQRRQEVRDHFRPDYYARPYEPPVEDPQADAFEYSTDWESMAWLGHVREQRFN